MPAQLLDGRKSRRVQKGHGQEGYVLIHATVPPLMKTALVHRARKNGRTLTNEVRVALAKHLEGDERR